MLRKLFSLILFVGFLFSANAQAYLSEITAFRKADSVAFPAKKQILFVGSSSFTKWKDVQSYFPEYPILNRGFGGSTLKDVIYFADDVILKYRPKQILIYCGENDFASSDTITVETVVSRFKQLFNLIRTKYKKVPIAYVSMKPSPLRSKLLTKYVLANKEIELFLQHEKRTAFIDVFHAMLNEDGTPIADIFIEDRLHMNAKGYAIWQKIIEPYLRK